MTGFGATLRRSWPVLVSYGLFSVWGVLCFGMSLVLSSGGFGVDPGDIPVLFGIFVATFVGHVIGNALGLLGLRLMPVVILFCVLIAGAVASGALLGPIALYFIVAIFSALGGYLGIASRLDVVAAWYPLSFCVAGAMIWMNRHGVVERFHSGSKHAIWDGFTVVCLSGGIFLMLVFLATRNSLGLTVWQEVARPRGLPTAEEGVAVARPGRGSLLVLFAFTLVVLGVTALVSPYLFRTVESKDGDGQSSADGQEQAKDGQSQSGDGQGDKSGQGKSGQGKGKNGKGKSGKSGSGGQGGSGGSEDGEGDSESDSDSPLGKADGDQAGKAASEALSLGMKLFMWLLVVALLLLVLLLVLLPPLRRAFLIRHLERPLWPVAPTSRVMNLWRRALAMLAVIDVEPSAGETPSDFARRAEQEVLTTLGCDSRGLKEAAAIVEKVDYAGRGLGADDEQMMRAAVTAFVAQVNPRVAVGKKLAAAWIRTPEVES